MMAEPHDDFDQNETMMNIINASTQYGLNQNEADQVFDDYLVNLEHEQEPPVQESVGEVYLLIVLHLLYI